MKRRQILAMTISLVLLLMTLALALQTEPSQAQSGEGVFAAHEIGAATSAKQCPRNGGTVTLRDSKTHKTIRKRFATYKACARYMSRHPSERIMRVQPATPTPRPTDTPTLTSTATPTPTPTPTATATAPPQPTNTPLPPICPASASGAPAPTPTELPITGNRMVVRVECPSNQPDWNYTQPSLTTVPRGQKVQLAVYFEMVGVHLPINFTTRVTDAAGMTVFEKQDQICGFSLTGGCPSGTASGRVQSVYPFVIPASGAPGTWTVSTTASSDNWSSSASVTFSVP